MVSNMIQTSLSSRRPMGLILLLSVLLAFGALACNDDTNNERDNFSRTDSATITVRPGALNFEQVAIGDTIAELVVIENTGAATLNVEELTIVGAQSRAFSLR